MYIDPYVYRSLCIYIYIVYIYIYIQHVHMYISICASIHIYIYMHIHAFTCLFMHTHAYTYTYIYIHIYICMYTWQSFNGQFCCPGPISFKSSFSFCWGPLNNLLETKEGMNFTWASQAFSPWVIHDIFYLGSIVIRS